MNCDPAGGPLCRYCQKPVAPGELRECTASPPALRSSIDAIVTDDEARQIFGDTDDPTLLGNRIATVTTAIGFPPCGGCDGRKEWINKAHRWWRQNVWFA